MIRWFSPHPLKSCSLIMQCHGRGWSLPLFWHLCYISAMCNFWHQLQILWGGGHLTLWPGLPNPLTLSVLCHCVYETPFSSYTSRTGHRSENFLLFPTYRPIVVSDVRMKLLNFAYWFFLHVRLFFCVSGYVLVRYFYVIQFICINRVLYYIGHLNYE